MNIAKLREDAVLTEKEQVSFIWKDQEITNFEYLEESRKLVTVLKDLGVKKGDRVIVQMPNCIEILQSFGAIWRLGAIVVPINYMMNDEEAASIYEDCGARIVISRSDFLPKIKAAQKVAPTMETILLVDETPVEGTLSFHELLNRSPETTEIVETDDDDIAALIYTAGTTGKSKGVMLSHYSLWANAKMQYESIIMPHGMTNITLLPLCHSYGIAVANSGLFRRDTTTVILDTFDLETILASIEKYKVNFIALVPTMYVFLTLYPDPKKYDLSSMQYWSCGSAPLSVDTWNRFKEMFGGEIIEGWGLTEGGANNACNPVDDRPVKVGSIGFPMKGTQMKIADFDGNEVPQGEQGEILLKGDSIMTGYWNKPEETAKVLRDGWLYTGDVGYVDEDGYYWITDRKKDLIIKGGENISPRKIEEVLHSHPKVLEAAVIAIDDDVYGENIKGFITLNPDQKMDSEEIIAFCKEKLSSFLVPKEIQILEALPKNLVGKIMKKDLRKMQ